MLNIILGFEKNFSAQKFGKGTSKGPDVDGFGIFVGGEHDFGGSVISGYYVFGYVGGVFFGGFVDKSRESEVTDFYFTSFGG